MRKMLPLILALPLLAAPAASIESPAIVAETVATTSLLPRWMAGCWLTESDNGKRTEECWTLPRGAMILGSSHTFKAGDSLWFEHARIIAVAGTLVYEAQPGGAATTSFPEAERGADYVEFRNAANDFPQRIRYWREGAALKAEISMMDGSGKVEWSFRSLSGG